jgi:beta-mannosidase
LMQPQIEADVTEENGTIAISLSTDCFAPFVWLEIGEDVIFSDNCFDLTSEETKTVFIQKEDVLSGKVLRAEDVRRSLKIKSLRDTYE